MILLLSPNHSLESSLPGREENTWLYLRENIEVFYDKIFEKISKNNYNKDNDTKEYRCEC